MNKFLWFNTKLGMSINRKVNWDYLIWDLVHLDLELNDLGVKALESCIKKFKYRNKIKLIRYSTKTGICTIEKGFGEMFLNLIERVLNNKKYTRKWEK